MNEVLRQEKKFLIGLPDYYYHSGNLAKFMLEDAHNRGDGYPIRSLYFDSLDDRDFQEKLDGLSIRRKIRLRCYGPDSPFALLEVKQKEGAMQKKRSLRLPREEAVRLTRGGLQRPAGLSRAPGPGVSTATAPGRWWSTAGGPSSPRRTRFE